MTENTAPAEPSIAIDRPLSRSAMAYRRLLAIYYRLLIPKQASVLEVGCGGGELLRLISAQRKVGIDGCKRRIERARVEVPEAEFHVATPENWAGKETFDYVIVLDTVNQVAVVQQLFLSLLRVCTPRTRLLLNVPNTLWRPFFGLADKLGMRQAQPSSSWL